MNENSNIKLKTIDRATLSNKYLEYRIESMKPKSFQIGLLGCVLMYYINRNIVNMFFKFKRTKFLAFLLLNFGEFNIFYYINNKMYLSKRNEKLIYKYSYILDKSQ